MQVVNNKGSDKVTIVFTADNRFSMPLAVALCSMIKNYQDNRKIVAFIIDGGITRNNKNKIIRSCQSDYLEINWVKPAKNLFPKGYIYKAHFSEAINYRIQISGLLPPDLAKVIYLDSDVVVLGNIAELWDIDIGEDYLLAQGRGILNSGVLLINLEKWREKNLSVALLDALRETIYDLKVPDQSLLNAVLFGKWGKLNYAWNTWPKNVNEKTKIVHFLTAKKPWGIDGDKVPNSYLFFKYLDMTAWSGWRLNFPRRLWQRAQFFSRQTNKAIKSVISSKQKRRPHASKRYHDQ
ncbi:MAG: glycosyltransferase family 8 protein [Candidatus Omnitrophota bacterium]|nr:MAG: glycosyltransferase family 8 protein [Candidatus Omnitrophota bacterium]